MSNESVPGWEDSGAVSGPHAVFPRRFGRYLLLRRLAHGGMGEVCIAKATGLAGIEKLCIVKTLRPDLTHDDADVARFVDEARTVVQLTHRNICQVFDVGEVGGRYYIAMELVLGQNLRVILDTAAQRGVRIHPDVGIHIVTDVLEALDYAHNFSDPLSGKPLRVVHRDVSPQNMMVSHQGEVKLIDFGIAVSSVKKLKTDPSVILGKVAYLSHEQAVGTPLGPETDQYAAAVVCYELVVGERFYEGLDAQQMLDAASNGNYVPRRMAELEPPLQEILSKALNGDPSQRWPTCGHLRESLLTYQEARGVRVDVKHVRELMTAVFGDDQARLASELQRLASISTDAGGTEPTRTIATKMRFHEGPPGETLDNAQLPGAESTQLVNRGRRLTGEIAAPPPPKRDTLVLAVAGILALVIVAAAVIAAALMVGDKHDTPVAVIDAVPVVAPPAVPPTEPAPAPAPPIAPSPSPPPPVATPQPVDPKPTATHGDRPNPKPRPKPTPPKATGSVPEKLSYLKSECPNLACTKTVLKKADAVLKLSIDETKKFKADLDQCVSKCR